jgi:acyl-CoA thioester hydrolase
MEKYVKELQIRWSDLDPNFHLRHSVYYDWGAFCRISFLEEQGLTTDVLKKLQIGPILFREECVFRKEINLGDIVTIDLQLVKAKKDFSRWSFRHNIIKNGDIVAALLTVDGAWLDVVKRKLASAGEEVLHVFSGMPFASDFQWTG